MGVDDKRSPMFGWYCIVAALPLSAAGWQSYSSYRSASDKMATAREYLGGVGVRISPYAQVHVLGIGTDKYMISVLHLR